MKHVIATGVLAFLAGTSAASAADLPVAPPPPPQAPAAYVPPPPVYNWGGIYIGLNGGYAFGSSDWEPAGGTATGNFDVNGGLAGGTIGANFQSGQFVFGVEADGDWTSIRGGLRSTTCPYTGTCTFDTSNDWLGTVRGRLGYAFDRVLVYGTAGGAFGDIKGAFSDTPAVGTIAISGKSTEFGWTAGAGVEVGITENITAKAEYLFVDLSKASVSCAAPTCAPAFTAPVSFDASLVRAGLNFKFNPF
jgi:outer membrane immunogenic protein